MHSQPFALPEVNDLIHIQQGLKRSWRPLDLIVLFEHTEVMGKRVPLHSWRQDQLSPQHSRQRECCYVTVVLVDETSACCVSQQHSEPLVHESLEVAGLNVVLFSLLLRADASISELRVVEQIRLPVKVSWCIGDARF